MKCECGNDDFKHDNWLDEEWIVCKACLRRYRLDDLAKILAEKEKEITDLKKERDELKGKSELYNTLYLNSAAVVDKEVKRLRDKIDEVLEYANRGKSLSSSLIKDILKEEVK